MASEELVTVSSTDGKETYQIPAPVGLGTITMFEDRKRILSVFVLLLKEFEKQIIHYEVSRSSPDIYLLCCYGPQNITDEQSRFIRRRFPEVKSVYFDPQMISMKPRQTGGHYKGALCVTHNSSDSYESIQFKAIERLEAKEHRVADKLSRKTVGPKGDKSKKTIKPKKQSWGSWLLDAVFMIPNLSPSEDDPPHPE